MAQYTFTVQGTSDELQRTIDANQGYLYLDMPAWSTRGYEDAEAGDGAIIEVADRDDKSCWIGRVEDVEWSGDTPAVHIAIAVS